MKLPLIFLFTSLTFAQSPFWTIEGFFGGDTTPPSIPSSILATGSADKVTLTWTDPTEGDFDSVRVYAGTTANPTTWVASVAKGVQSYKDSAYSYNTIQHYRIKSKDVNGNLSDYSSSVNDTVMMNLGSELLSNGTFTSNTTGWTGGNGTLKWYNTDWNAIGQTNMALDSATATAYVSVYQSYSFTSGYKYYLTYSYFIPTNTTTVRIVPAFIGGASDVYGTAATTVGSLASHSQVMTATASHTTIRFYQATNASALTGITAGDKMYIDNVSVKRILNP